MNNANEASLYCRRLESITSSPQMLKMQTYCSSISARKITKPYYSTCVAVADFLLHRGVDCRMQCSRLRAGYWLGLPFISFASLYKNAKQRQRTAEGDRHILSMQYGEEWSRLSSFRFWLQNIKPLTIGIVLHYFPPFPPFFASKFRSQISRLRPESALFPRVNLADFRRGGDWGGRWLGQPSSGHFPKQRNK